MATLVFHDDIAVMGLNCHTSIFIVVTSMSQQHFVIYQHCLDKYQG